MSLTSFIVFLPKFRYLNPRKGTKTSKSRTATYLTINVQIPKSPRGDGNRWYHLSLYCTQPFRYLDPREGTETTLNYV